MNIKDKAVNQKRKFISISNTCNNNCLFCLGKDNHNGTFEKYEDLVRELESVEDKANTKLIISGIGEASIHPDFIRIISYAKSKGFLKIQTITNGRLFSNDLFLKKSVTAGLSEISFSVHGATEKTHDLITQTKGSFHQLLKAILNVKDCGIIINSNIVLTSKNIDEFSKIIGLLLKLGVREFDILYLVPFGSAWENWRELHFDLNEKKLQFQKGINLARKYNSVIWANRIPPEYLENNEDLIQSPKKLEDEIIGRKDMYKDSLEKKEKPICYGDRCECCYIKDLCYCIIEVSAHNKNSVKQLSNQTIANNDIEVKLDSKNPVHINQMLDNLSEEDLVKITLVDIPKCLIGEIQVKEIKESEFHLQTKYYLDNNRLDIIQIAKDYIPQKKIKTPHCRNCEYNTKCSGIFYTYVKKYGFPQKNNNAQLNFVKSIN